MTTRLLMLLVLLLLPSLAHATDFYVGQTATGAGTGTSSSNLCGGLADADCTPSAGDTVYLCGAFTSRQTAYAVNGTAGSRITYDFNCAGNPATLTLDAATNEGFYINGRSYVTLSNARVTGATLGDASPAALIVVNNSSNIILNDSDTYNNTEAVALRGHGLVCITCSNVTMNRPISRGNIGHGIDVINGGGTTSHHVTVDQFLVYNNRRTGVQFEGPSGFQDRNRQNTASNGTAYGNGDGLYSLHGTDNVFVNNLSYSNTNTANGAAEGYGLAIQQTLTSRVEGNTVHDNRTDGIEVWGSATESSNGCIVRSNTAYGNNLFTANPSGGNGIQESTGYAAGCLITGNVSYNNIQDYQLANDVSGTSVFTNNVSYGGTYGLYLSDSNEAGTNAVTGWVIANNIFAHNVTRWMYTVVTSANSNTFAKNDWVGTSGAVYNNVTYTSGDITTVDATALTVDPLWVNVTAYDFRTKAASTLRRAGQVGLPCLDVRGRPCWTPPDIGAYQASSGDLVTARTVATARAGRVNTP